MISITYVQGTFIQLGWGPNPAPYDHLINHSLQESDEVGEIC